MDSPFITTIATIDTNANRLATFTLHGRNMVGPALPRGTTNCDGTPHCQGPHPVMMYLDAVLVLALLAPVSVVSGGYHPGQIRVPARLLLDLART